MIEQQGTTSTIFALSSDVHQGVLLQRTEAGSRTSLWTASATTAVSAKPQCRGLQKPGVPRTALGCNGPLGAHDQAYLCGLEEGSLTDGFDSYKAASTSMTRKHLFETHCLCASFMLRTVTVSSGLAYGPCFNTTVQEVACKPMASQKLY
jgi:hypothetical protein